MGAHVRDVSESQPSQLSVFFERRNDRSQTVARGRRGRKGVGAVFDPFDWRACLAADRCQKHDVGKDGLLDAETSAAAWAVIRRRRCPGTRNALAMSGWTTKGPWKFDHTV